MTKTVSRTQLAELIINEIDNFADGTIGPGADIHDFEVTVLGKAFKVVVVRQEVWSEVQLILLEAGATQTTTRVN